MGPKSNFITYLRNNTNKNVTLSLTSEMKKMEGYDYEMETTITLNPDLSGLERAYSVDHNKLSDWRLKGFF